MTIKNSTPRRTGAPDHSGEAGAEDGQKGPPEIWERPRILWREPLEGVAVVCSPPGKADAVSCPLGPINS